MGGTKYTRYNVHNNVYSKNMVFLTFRMRSGVWKRERVQDDDRVMYNLHVSIIRHFNECLNNYTYMYLQFYSLVYMDYEIPHSRPFIYYHIVISYITLHIWIIKYANLTNKLICLLCMLVSSYIPCIIECIKTAPMDRWGYRHGSDYEIIYFSDNCLANLSRQSFAKHCKYALIKRNPYYISHQ